MKKTQMKQRKVLCLLVSLFLSTAMFVALFTADVLIGYVMVNRLHIDMVGTIALLTMFTLPIVLAAAGKVMKITFHRMYRALIVE